MITFTVYGDPVAQARGRATIINNRVIVYDPARSREFKKLIKEVAQKYAGNKLIQEPVSLSVKAFISIPMSFSKKKREKALTGKLRPTTRPDLKNIIAGVEDALKGVIYKDDSQIIDFGDSGKWYGDPPRVEISIRKVETNDEKSGV